MWRIKERAGSRGSHRPARLSDLGYLLHKHPDRVPSFDLSFGEARVELFDGQTGANRLFSASGAESRPATSLLSLLHAVAAGIFHKVAKKICEVLHFVFSRPAIAAFIREMSASQRRKTNSTRNCQLRLEVAETFLLLVEHFNGS